MRCMFHARQEVFWPWQGEKGWGRAYNTKMPVNGCDPLVCAGLQQLRCNDLLNRQDNAIPATDSD